MDIFTLTRIISFLDHDSKLICNRINSTFRNIIGDVEWYINRKIYTTTKLVKKSRISLNGRHRINAVCGFYGSNRLYTYLTRQTLRTQYGTIFKNICLNCQKDFLIRILDDIPIEKYMTQEYFIHACVGGDIELMDMFLDETYTNIDIDYVFVDAYEMGNLFMMDYLISKGVSAYGVERCMLKACKEGNYDMVKYMISKGADDFDTGLSIACENDHNEIIKLMIENGAELII